MPNPLTAKEFDQAMDPADIVDFETTISQGTDPANLLLSGEHVASYTLTATAEAVAAGLQVLNDSGRSPSLVGNILRFWLSVVASQQSADLFGGDGADLAVELTINTDSSPSRRRQRTMLVKVAQQ